MQVHEIMTVPISQLIPAPYNPRVDLKPGDDDYEKLRRSMNEFGCVEPIVWNKRSGYVVSGHQRLKVLQGSGATEIECVAVDLDHDRERALNVAMNKIGGAWDEDKLRELLDQMDAEFDKALTGFDAKEIQALLDAARTAEQDDFDVDAALEEIVEPVTRRGDIWLLGEHRLMCGDSTSAADVERLMDGHVAQLVVTDPPYNVDYHGKAGSIANDHMESEVFRCFLESAFLLMHKHSAPGAAAYIFHAETEALNFILAYKSAGFLLKQRLIWVKNRFAMGRQDYQWRHEGILYGWKGGAAHYFADDRTQSTVLFEGDLPDPQHLKKAELVDLLNRYIERDNQVAQSVLFCDKPLRNPEHPTMKPVPLVGQIVKNSSKPGWDVLDMFGGSGTTLMACEQLGRRALLMEIDERHCDCTIRRWETATGKKATKESAL